ncbi:unnamed protein product [Ceratitis capitata]|uniref:(Mediterranean fruit fly) hypothetical protein n=1 Tax=Ceratitis capitata TaxID=7213 RepID=A0A811UN93_CERCA|nr:unnamed protein product [Ceratitis capitata]
MMPGGSAHAYVAAEPQSGHSMLSFWLELQLQLPIAAPACSYAYTPHNGLRSQLNTSECALSTKVTIKIIRIHRDAAVQFNAYQTKKKEEKKRKAQQANSQSVSLSVSNEVTRNGNSLSSSLSLF